MKDLKPFTPAGKIECSKCLNGYMELKLYHDGDGNEYIEVTCGACGHSWNMETADSGKKDIIMEAPEVVDKNLTDKLELVEDKKAETALEGIAKVDDDETKEAPVEVNPKALGKVIEGMGRVATGKGKKL